MIEVVKAGHLMSFQDQGREGYRAMGVAVSGAMDQLCMARMNTLLENEMNAPVVEWFASEAVFLAVEGITLCLSGVVKEVLLNGERVLTNTRLHLESGDQLKVIPSFRSAWLYLSVSGGFKVEDVLGSASTLLSAEIGGHEGRVLKNKDLLQSGKRRCGLQKIGFMKPFASRTIHYIREASHEVPLNAHTLFQTQSFQVSAHSNRVGYRLTGESLLNGTNIELKTHGVIPGTIQLPPDGQPIVLMRDAQPTGGYPKIGYVIPCDLSRLAQCPQRSYLKFVEVTAEQAEEIEMEESEELRLLSVGVKAAKGV